MDLQQYYQTGAYRNAPKPTTPTYVAPKTSVAEEESGGGGASPGWLQQAIRGPQWGADNTLIGQNPQPRGFNKIARPGQKTVSNQPIPITQAQQDEWTRMTGGQPFTVSETQSQQDQQPQYPSWLQGVNGGMFQPGDMPIWTPTNWVNPSNPNPIETQPGQTLEPGLGTGMGVGNTTGLLASLLSNAPKQTTPTYGGVDYIAELQRQKQGQVPVGLTEANQPIDQTLSSFGKLVFHRNALPNIAGATNMSLPNQPSGAGYPMGAGPLTNKVIAPSTASGVGMGDLRKFEATQGQAATGAIPPEEAAILQKYGIDPSTVTRGGGGAPATGGTTLEQLATKALERDKSGIMKGVSLEELQAAGEAINRDNPNTDSKWQALNGSAYPGGGKPVRVYDKSYPLGYKDFPQIAGWYVNDFGQYFPIDTNAVSKFIKRYGGLGYSNGGGYGPSYGSGGQKGWLASWNITV
jgi:hypothetical protein